MSNRIPMVPRQVAEERIAKYSNKIRDAIILYSVYRNESGFDVEETVNKLSEHLTAISKIRPNVRLSKDEYKSLIFPFGLDKVACRRTLALFKEVNVTENHIYPEFVINRYNVSDMYDIVSKLMAICVPMFSNGYNIPGYIFVKVVRNVLFGEGIK